MATRSPSARRGPSARQGFHPHSSVQGGSLRTWSQGYPTPNNHEVVLGTDGRPMDANVEVWQGPGNTPRRMRVYSDDGFLRPFRSSEPGRGQPNSIAVQNTGPLEFPLSAEIAGEPLRPQPNPSEPPLSAGWTVQGGATRSFPIDASVNSVRIFMQTEGRNFDARVEVLQGPDSVRQVIELGEDFGYDRPFSCEIDTPGYGCVIRILNTGPMELPFKASVVPLSFKRPDYGYSSRGARMGGGSRARLAAYDPSGPRRWGGQDSLGGYGSGGYSRYQNPNDPYLY